MSKWTNLWVLLLLCALKSAFSESESDEPYDVFDDTDLIYDENGVAKYNGAQLWRVLKENDSYSEILDELPQHIKVSLWGSQKTHVDIFVKEAELDNSKKYLDENELKFKVVIENIQEAIDTENPPKDEISHWQVRNGKF